MSQQNSNPPEGFAECLKFLAENGIVVQNNNPLLTSPTPATSGAPDSLPKVRKFTRLGRGTGGELTQKEKVSKDITAPGSKKRKPLIDSTVNSPVSESGMGTGARQVKRLKTQVSTPFLNHND